MTEIYLHIYTFDARMTYMRHVVSEPLDLLAEGWHDVVMRHRRRPVGKLHAEAHSTARLAWRHRERDGDEASAVWKHQRRPRFDRPT